MKIPVGLYLHVPFCTNKCGYCDFNSWGETRRAPQQAWLDSILRQLDVWLESWQANGVEASFDTVFFGGGTPSLLAPDLLETLGREIARRSPERPVEFTAECNPETIDRAKLEALRALGATRLSIGIQSFDDAYLERLERQARSRDNVRALELVASEWSGPWSLDLMFALPGQTPEHWARTLDQALAFGPSHLSAYQLTLTTARSQAWNQAGEEGLLEFFDLTEERLAQVGLERYEVSNFARRGQECRHNLKYWRIEPFLGLGPGASGLLSSSLLPGFEAPNGAHQKNPSGFESWVESSRTLPGERAKLEPRSASDHLFEMLMMGLRLSEGLDEGRLGVLAGGAKEVFSSPELTNYFSYLNGRWKATAKGLRILDGLLPRIYQRFEIILKKASGPNLDSSPFDPMFSGKSIV